MLLKSGLTCGYSSFYFIDRYLERLLATAKINGIATNEIIEYATTAMLSDSYVLIRYKLWMKKAEGSTIKKCAKLNNANFVHKYK